MEKTRNSQTEFDRQLQHIQEIGLHTYLDEIRNELHAISNALNNYYFAHY